MLRSLCPLNISSHLCVNIVMTQSFGPKNNLLISPLYWLLFLVCDSVSDKKQLKGGRVCFELQFKTVVFIMEEWKWGSLYLGRTGSTEQTGSGARHKILTANSQFSISFRKVLTLNSSHRILKECHKLWIMVQTHRPMTDLSHSNHISYLGPTMRQSLGCLVIQNAFIATQTVPIDFDSLYTVQ